MYDRELLEWADKTLARVSKNRGGNQVFDLPPGVPPSQLADFVHGYTHNCDAFWFSKSRKAVWLRAQGPDRLILFADWDEFWNSVLSLRDGRQIWSTRKIRRS